MKIQTNSKKASQRGSVLLPVFGFFYWYPCWMVLFGGAAAAVAWLAHSGHPILSTLSGGAVFVGYFTVFPFLLIAAAIAVEGLETVAMVAGIGGGQYWSGKRLFEKISREIFRGLTFFGGAYIAWLALEGISSLLVVPQNPAGTHLKVMLFCSSWQIAVSLLTLLLGAIKLYAPRFGWFEGDPKYVYPHVF